jgi:hypothetical protein
MKHFVGVLTFVLAFIYMVEDPAAQQQPTCRSFHAVKAVLDELLPQGERTIGHPLAIEYNRDNAED